MKIDVTKIDGFESMDAEAKVNALMGYDIEVPESPQNDDVTKYKNLLSKANSEAAEYKNKWRATLSEQERIAAEQAEVLAEKDARLKAYERNDKIHEYESNYLALGYDKDLARATAEAQLDGNMSVVFENMNLFHESQKKSWESNYLNSQPSPSVGKPIAAEEVEKQKMDTIRKYMGL